MRTQRRAALTALALALVVSACSSGSDSASEVPPAPIEPPVDAPALPADGQDLEEGPEVKVDEEIARKLDVAPGSAVIPGSIESVRVEDLSSACAAGAEPMRLLMAEYASVRQVPADGTYEAARRSAIEACTDQEWSDFYTREVAGWIHAAPR